MPVPGVAQDAECCGNCTAFLADQQRVKLKNGATTGRCIAHSPAVLVVRQRQNLVPAADGSPVALITVEAVDGFFPPTNSLLRCRDDYRRRIPLELNLPPDAAPAPERQQ